MARTTNTWVIASADKIESKLKIRFMNMIIAATDTADFPMLARFQDLKAQGGLSSAEEIAAHIAAMIADRNFGKAIVQDVRDWQPSA